jgi:hypothetical protein
MKESLGFQVVFVVAFFIKKFCLLFFIVSFFYKEYFNIFLENIYFKEEADSKIIYNLFWYLLTLPIFPLNAFILL